MESEKNQEFQINFYMMMFMIIESTLEVGNITQVKSDGCVLMTATLFWPNIRFNKELKSYHGPLQCVKENGMGNIFKRPEKRETIFKNYM